MSLNTKRIAIFIMGLALCVALLMVADQERRRHLPPDEMTTAHLAAIVKDNSAACISCHAEKSPGVVGQWASSAHAIKGIGCMDCHGAVPEDAASWTHEGALITSIVTPRTCAECHPKELVEFAASHHNTAAMFIGSLDNYLGSFVEGRQAAVLGCQQCHGGPVRYTKHFEDSQTFTLDMQPIVAEASATLHAQGKDPRKHKDELRAEMAGLIQAAYEPYVGKLCKRIEIDSDTWPNSGIGRFNPDGSMGTCNACHSRHSFSKALARQPENCGKCHMGPDHPQIEVYNESKHGIAFRNQLAEMNLDAPEWIVGEHYTAAPTCATCHMSAYRTAAGVQPVTHDVGLRISWTLRPIISTKTTSHSATINHANEVVHFDRTWEQKRQDMKGVCLACHGTTHVDNFYDQFDGLVGLYNDKFATPAQELMQYVVSKGYVNTEVPFGSDLEWVFFELWHHEGRRMRHGAAMMGPDYTHWHGSYEVAKHFYFKFIPMLEELAEQHDDDEFRLMIAEVLDRPEHKWRQGLSPEQRRQMFEFYQQRYGQKTVLQESS